MSRVPTASDLLLEIEREKIQVVVRECVRLTEERDRLRAALAVFADPRHWRKANSMDGVPTQFVSVLIHDPIDFARRALEGQQ